MSMNIQTPLLINTRKNNYIYTNNFKINMMFVMILIILSISTINLIFLVRFNNIILLIYNEASPYLNKTKNIIDIICLDIKC
jgi:hypothetical protein